MDALAKETAIILVPIVTIILGFIIGWLGQRSGFCSIGGIRDFILFRQTRLLKGYIGLIVSAFVFYLLFSFLIPTAFPKFFWLLQDGNLFTAIPGAPAGLSVAATIICMIVGGIFVGIIGTLLGGCPLRQVVMTSEGNVKSGFFVIGMIIGALIFSAFVLGWVVNFFGLVGI
ncbi:MAG: YeeE/YedE thiosulfate transporter family protein [Methanocorpusculum sp.]|nr:YeeE/YedE thiosulfate transporter family protein [Methanocorpusculum sp.]